MWPIASRNQRKQKHNGKTQVFQFEFNTLLEIIHSRNRNKIIDDAKI